MLRPALPSEKGVFYISHKQLLTARLHQAEEPEPRMT